MAAQSPSPCHASLTSSELILRILDGMRVAQRRISSEVAEFGPARNLDKLSIHPRPAASTVTANRHVTIGWQARVDAITKMCVFRLVHGTGGGGLLTSGSGSSEFCQS